MMKNTRYKVSFIFLFIVAIIGTLLRSVAYLEIPLQYAHLVHAHSHVAFQGWVYTILFLLLIDIFLTREQIRKGHYILQFWLTIIVVVGILISFSLQGYALYSIICATLFQILNYWFIFRCLKDLKSEKARNRNCVSVKFIKTGLILGVISTLLPIAIGVLSAKGFNGTETYQSVVYTFLYLQYNGWFLFVVLGLLFNFMDRNNLQYKQKYANNFYKIFTFVVIPAIALLLIGMEYGSYIMPIAYISAILLAISLVYFIASLPRNIYVTMSEKGNWFKLYFFAFLGSLVIKLCLQFLSVFPVFRTQAFYNKNIIIAYLHLSLIGAISFLFFALIIEKKWLPLNGFVKAGTVLFMSGFLITEILLVITGLGIFHSQETLILGSAAMAIGIFLMLISRKINS